LAQCRAFRVVCLVDNTARPGSRLRTEHGLAFLIETDAGRVLFDTGRSGTVLLHNAAVLGIDLATVDALAISHGHNDHADGLAAALDRTRPGLPLYAHPDLFRERFSRPKGKLKSVGMALRREELAARTTLHLSAAPQEILPGVWTSGEIVSRSEPEGRSAWHVVRTETGWAPDPYRDDMSLVLEVETGIVLLCGCCHAGLLNTLQSVEHTFQQPVVAIAGGTHLVGADADHLKRVREAIGERASMKRLYLNHCSGEKAFSALRLGLGPGVVQSCPAGTQLDAEILS
jgi:7,8-dihydropterin-6-yl-methyl-4-(beta-D-ribofuranosyl)aminobenzene 5'-phosphate synthase